MSTEEKLELLNNQNWEQIIKEATVHTIYQFKYRGILRETALKGYTPKEIVMQAIEKVYTGEWKWNPSKSNLITYLKYHVIKGLISNLIRSEEVKTGSQDEILEINMPLSNEDIIDNLSAKQVIEYIVENLQGDEDAIIIFNGLCDGLKRGDICDVNSWKKGRFDNAMKRLKTQLKGMKLREIIK